MTTRAEIISEARNWIGTPYRHQASAKQIGCDCLGLVRGVWRAVHGVEPEPVPAYTSDWAEAAGRETLRDAARKYMTEIPLDEIEPGDVLLFRWRAHLPAKHMAIASGPDTIIHAHEGLRVTETALAKPWLRKLSHAFQFPGVTG